MEEGTSKDAPDSKSLPVFLCSKLKIAKGEGGEEAGHSALRGGSLP